MRTGAAVAAMAATAMTVWAGGAGQAAERTVTVCVQGDDGFAATTIAKEIASKMFADIGVRIVWLHGRHACPSGRGGIVVSFDDRAAKGAFPGALAYAHPFEGTHIVVLQDRVNEAVGRLRVPFLLAHVLVHEITHILQAVDRHSASGVMKAHWSDADEIAMVKRPLRFTEADVELIYMGLDSRASRLAVLARAQ